MEYEREQARLQRLLEEILSDDEIMGDESDHEEDVIETRDENTDTEQSEEEVENESHTVRLRREPAFTGKDGVTVWKKHRPTKTVRTRAENKVLHLPGVTPRAKLAKTPIQCWELFFSNDILDIIVEETNKFIQTTTTGFTRERSARPTDKIEIRAFLGLLYMAGCLKSSRLNYEELWDRKGCGVEIFWLTMSQQRFLFLLRTIRFDDLTTRDVRRMSDKLAAIRSLFELFVNNCKNNYIISEYATIDEMLLGFRGRCAFRQYIPSKPNKYGIKMFSLVDSKMFYTKNIEIYAGQQPEGLFQVNNDPASVVQRLIKPISGTGRNITCDNYFTSFNLIDCLLHNCKLTFVGTVRKNKREIPPEFLCTKGRPVGSSIFGYQANTTLVSYVPKKGKNVILASSLHHDDTIDPNTGDKNKPEIISFYNSTKGGVDTVDLLSSNYDVARKTRRWPMVIFYGLMNIAGINAQVIHTANNSHSKLLRRKFLKSIALSLVDEHLKRRSLAKNLPIEVRQRRLEVAGTSTESVQPQVIPPWNSKKMHRMSQRE